MPNGLRAVLSLSLWIGGGLLAARVAIVFVLRHHMRGEDAAAVLWRLSHAVPSMAAYTLGAGLLLATILVLLTRRGLALTFVALLVAAGVMFAALSGLPFGDEANVPGLGSSRGRLGIRVLAIASLTGAALAVWLGRMAHRGTRAGRALRSRPVLAGGLVLALLAPCAFFLFFENRRPLRNVRVRLLEVAFEPELWRATRSHPENPVELGVLTPSRDWRFDGGDLPGLVMVPPAEVRFQVPNAPQGIRFRAAAGVDNHIDHRLQNFGLQVTVQFRILVDGKLVFEERVGVGDPDTQLTWIRLPGAGLPVPPGAEVVLSTDVLIPDGVSLAGHPPLKAGFGELVLERVVQRPRALARPETPSVILIVMDTLRADRMSCYGYPVRTTPNVDRLAERGLLFEEAYATSSWTWPATASILTGLIPEAHQVTSNDSCYLDGRFVTLAEVLGERDYVTAAFSCNPLIVPDKNFDQGFESFDSSGNFRRTSRIANEILAWLREHRQDRFFLYLHLVDPHWEYELLPESVALVGLGESPAGFPPRGIVDYQQMLMRGHGHGPDGELITDQAVPREHREHMSRQYDAAVHTGDHYVGLVLDELTRLGLDDSTVVVFTSDHGEELLDHGLLAHGLTLHRELTRVPLILAGPSIPAGRRIETFVSNRHLAPTIALLAGAELSQLESSQEGSTIFADYPDFGEPILLIEPERIREEPIFFSTHQGWWKGRVLTPIYGLIEGEWEVHYAPTGRPWGAAEDAPQGDFALYHLPTDPEQHNDLAREQPERARAMIARMQAHHESARSVGRDLRLGAGQAALEYLMGIGYLGTDSRQDEE